MPFVTRKTLFVLGCLSGAAVLAAAAFVWSGAYNIGADDQHTRPVYVLMQTMRERSIEARASKLQVPDLKDPARIRQGAGNYNAMCMGCHLAPGMQATELSRGLYPAPPDLTQDRLDAAKAFWVIKHGIKASGMPAWGKSMEDEYIWNMAAFLQRLPKLDAAQYQALVESSGGHDHGGGETKPHHHAEGANDHHAASETAADVHAGMDMSDDTAHTGNQSNAQPAAKPAPTHPAAVTDRSLNAAPEMVEHRHADGTVESHPAPEPQGV